MEHAAAQPRMVAVQLGTDEGAFICNVKESDLPKIDAGKAGTLIVIYSAIRLDAMIGERYELHERKAIEASSIDFCQSLQGRPHDAGKQRLTLCARKGRQNG